MEHPHAPENPTRRNQRPARSLADLICTVTQRDPAARARMLEAQAMKAWRALVPPYIAEQTFNCRLDGYTLTFRMGDPSLRAQCQMKRDILRDELNQQLGNYRIQNLQFS